MGEKNRSRILPRRTRIFPQNRRRRLFWGGANCRAFRLLLAHGGELGLDLLLLVLGQNRIGARRRHVMHRRVCGCVGGALRRAFGQAANLRRQIG